MEKIKLFNKAFNFGFKIFKYWSWIKVDISVVFWIFYGSRSDQKICWGGGGFKKIFGGGGGVQKYFLLVDSKNLYGRFVSPDPERFKKCVFDRFCLFRTYIREARSWRQRRFFVVMFSMFTIKIGTSRSHWGRMGEKTFCPRHTYSTPGAEFCPSWQPWKDIIFPS